jgi:hypothetical protein
VALAAPLREDEFVVCQDESVHIVYFSDLQLKFSPAVIRLTNQRVLIEATCEANRSASIKFAEIQTFAQNTYNECPVLHIILLDGVGPVRVLIPDDGNRMGFASLLSHICQLTDASPDALAGSVLSLRRRFQPCTSLSDFYASATPPPSRDDASEVVVDHESTMLRSFLDTELIWPLAVVADFLQHSPSVFFFAAFFGTAVLSIVFRRVSPGARVCAGILGGIVEGGLRIIARRRAPARLPQIAEGESPSPLKAFVLAMMSIQEAAMNRLGWADRSAILEVMAIALAGGAKRRFLHCELAEKL